jgi:hypothetical protein
MQHPTPDDFVIATGETHSVKEWIELAFQCVGIENWEDYVDYDKSLTRPAEVDLLCGDALKSKQLLGFEPKVKFKDTGNYLLSGTLVLLALFLTAAQFKNDTNFRSAVKMSDIGKIKNSGLDWPQDVHRMNFVSKILRENGFEVEGLEVVRKSIEINPSNVESWKEISRFNSITSNEKRLAEENIKLLDPYGSKF